MRLRKNLNDFSAIPLGQMSAQQLERALSRLKMETDEKYDALWKRYTKEKEQYEITIAHILRTQELDKKIAEAKAEQQEIQKAKDNYVAEHRGPSEFTALAKDLRDCILQSETDCGCQVQGYLLDVKVAFEQLFRIITERRTPSYQDIDNIRTIRKSLEPILDA